MIFSALIVDDEPNAREYLKSLVKEHDSLELCGTCISGNEAIIFCKTLTPDLIFLDIQMPGKTGIEVAKILRHNSAESIIIFTTAYDQFAIKAFEVAAVGYLLKPFSFDQFDEAVHQAIIYKETQKKADFGQKMDTLYHQFIKSSSIKIEKLTINEKGLEINITVDNILYLIADSEYVTIHTSNRKYLKRMSLKILSEQLPNSFMRIHRSIIINQEMVASFNYLNNGTFSFKFNDGTELVSSRSYQKQLQDVLKVK